MSFAESDSGNTIFSFHPPTPLIAKNGEIHWLSQKGIKLLSGKNYLIECQAKGEGLQSQHASVKDIFAKKVLYARTFVFKVDPHISLPGKLFWQIKGNGKIYKQGEITLVAPRKRIAPKRLDCSVWLCESSFGAESLPIQRLYVEKLHSWGLNTVEPQMNMPAYKTPLTKEILVIPSALEAKRLGMRIRAYMHFLYVDGSFADYLATNPQYA
ncbi:hypothetical protein EOM81_13210, partial [bacterium]|nr:hypothetical protein [bacterium]